MKITQKIPLINIPDKPIAATTQEHLPIADVTRNMVLFKDGGAALVLESTSLNFGLLSDREQEAVVAAYAALINSLSFSIQILVRTQKKDISSYLTYLDEAIPKAKNDQLKGLMVGYRQFIADTIKKRNVLGKRFFIVIPFSPYELGISTKSFIDSVASKKQKPVRFSKEYVLKKAEIALFPKRDHLIRQAARLGLRLSQLNNQELVSLFYDTYNPPPEAIKSEDTETEANGES